MNKFIDLKKGKRMGNEVNLNGVVLAESKAAGTPEEPIVSRIRPTYTDALGKIHIALIETLASCIVGKDGKRLDRIIQELQDAVGLFGGVLFKTCSMI